MRSPLRARLLVCAAARLAPCLAACLAAGLVVGLAAGLAGCESSGVGLRVTVRTDLVPGVEVAAAEAEIEGRPVAHADLGPDSGTFDPGVLVGDFSRLPPDAERELTVRLLDATGAVVVERPMVLAHRRALSLLVVLSRDCVGVACPNGDDPEVLACLGGHCVPSSCVTADDDLCAEAVECEEAADCPPLADCAAISCFEGVCLYDHDGEACGESQSCHPVNGCSGEPPPDAGL